MTDTTCIIVHYDTPDLLTECLNSLRHFYPYLPALVIDGGSTLTNSLETLDELTRYPYNDIVRHPTNLGHGPGMAMGALAVDTRFFLTLDSDCVVLGAGWVEQMEEALAEPFVYACGRVIGMNSRGRRDPEGTPYCHPTTALWNREVYLQFPPFEQHGSPCLRNQLHAQLYGWKVRDFPVDDHVFHRGRGTRDRHGARWCDRGEVTVE